VAEAGGCRLGVACDTGSRSADVACRSQQRVCTACNKTFRSQKAWQHHRKSKKHAARVQYLQKMGQYVEQDEEARQQAAVEKGKHQQQQAPEGAVKARAVDQSVDVENGELADGDGVTALHQDGGEVHEEQDEDEEEEGGGGDFGEGQIPDPPAGLSSKERKKWLKRQQRLRSRNPPATMDSGQDEGIPAQAAALEPEVEAPLSQPPPQQQQQQQQRCWDCAGAGVVGRGKKGKGKRTCPACGGSGVIGSGATLMDGHNDNASAAETAVDETPVRLTAKQMKKLRRQKQQQRHQQFGVNEEQPAAAVGGLAVDAGKAARLLQAARVEKMHSPDDAGEGARLSGNLRKGTKVRARFPVDGELCTAKIAGVTDDGDQYIVNWDDGAQEHRLLPFDEVFLPNGAVESDWDQGNDHDGSHTNEMHVAQRDVRNVEPPIQLSKREKRRAKKGKGKAESPGAQTPTGAFEDTRRVVCVVCGDEFPTRAQLFKHVQKTGHAVVVDSSPPSMSTSTGGSKREKKEMRVQQQKAKKERPFGYG
jgi:hypothetical protein